MATFKIASWNVNSLKVRLPQVLTWLAEAKPDVLALQELKLTDEDFPLAALQEAGYSAVFSGQKTYNGVAIISRTKASDVIADIPQLEDIQRRILVATINGIRIVNLYIPNGESVTSAKYQYKLGWLEKMHLFLQQELQQHAKLLVLGDFNIAPHELDVHDAQYWDEKVLFSTPERNAFNDMLQLGLIDCFRHLHPTEKQYSWWDYRMNAFKRNLGLRIDHILVNHTLATDCTACYIDKMPRTWERPSDHTPVIAEFSFP